MSGKKELEKFINLESFEHHATIRIDHMICENQYSQHNHRITVNSLRFHIETDSEATQSIDTTQSVMKYLKYPFYSNGYILSYK